MDLWSSVRRTPTTTLQMNRNIVTGWTYGIRIDTNAAMEATLRDNRIFGNAEYGLKSHQTPVDATSITGAMRAGRGQKKGI